MEKPWAWHGSFGCAPQSSALRANSGEGTRSPCVMPKVSPAASIPPPFGQLRGRLKAGPGRDQGSPSPFRNHFGSSLFASRLARVGGLPQPACFRQEPLPATVLLKPPPKKGPPSVWAGPLVHGGPPVVCASKRLQRAFQIGDHAGCPAARLDHLPLGENGLLGEGESWVVFQVHLLGFLPQRRLLPPLTPAGAELLQTYVAPPSPSSCPA